MCLLNMHRERITSRRETKRGVQGENYCCKRQEAVDRHNHLRYSACCAHRFSHKFRCNFYGIRLPKLSVSCFCFLLWISRLKVTECDTCPRLTNISNNISLILIPFVHCKNQKLLFTKQSNSCLRRFFQLIQDICIYVVFFLL